ncbi:hypothetical protein ACHAXN_007449 [Cyclotella atomus]
MTSPLQMQKHHMCDLSADESLSPRSECSSRSESPLPMDPISPVSPRSIFKSYWLSPKGIDEEEELSRKLSSLQMPLVTADDDERSNLAIDEEHKPSTKDDFNEASSELCSSSDDTPILSKVPPAPERPRRRQILPTPPQSSVPPKPTCLRSCCRPWSSTSALIKKPRGSCLRPSRYSFSGSPSVASLDDVHNIQEVSTAHNAHHKKEVSFYAQVSVFEFTVPQEQRSDGWSKYFV